MTTIIAELGSNPRPLWQFEPWCAAAAAAGADAVKVQLWQTDSLYPVHMRADMRPREFPRARLREFVICAHAYGLAAGASVFDTAAVALAAEWCDWLKLAASQENNNPLRMACYRTGKRLYRSISDMELAQNEYSTLLYAIQKYPASMLLSLWRLWRWAGVARTHMGGKFGWSSHTRGIFDCTVAAELGATVIEKHFALSPADCEAGHSLLPDKFAAMVRAVRAAQH